MPTPRVEAAAEGMPSDQAPFYREHKHPEEAHFVRTLTVLDLKLLIDAVERVDEAFYSILNQPRAKDAAICNWFDQETDRLTDMKSYAMEELFRRPMTGDRHENETRIGYIAKWDLHDCGSGFLETIAKLVAMKERAEKAEFEAKRAEKATAKVAA